MKRFNVVEGKKIRYLQNRLQNSRFSVQTFYDRCNGQAAIGEF